MQMAKKKIYPGDEFMQWGVGRSIYFSKKGEVRRIADSLSLWTLLFSLRLPSAASRWLLCIFSPLPLKNCSLCLCVCGQREGREKFHSRFTSHRERYNLLIFFYTYFIISPRSSFSELSRFFLCLESLNFILIQNHIASSTVALLLRQVSSFFTF